MLVIILCDRVSGSIVCACPHSSSWWCHDIDLLPDTYNCGFSMRRECRECFSRHRLQWKPLVSDPGMHHGACAMHVPWCMSGSLTRDGGENVPGIPVACATRNFTYLVRGSLGITSHCTELVGSEYTCFNTSTFKHSISYHSEKQGLFSQDTRASVCVQVLTLGAYSTLWLLMPWC